MEKVSILGHDHPSIAVSRPYDLDVRAVPFSER